MNTSVDELPVDTLADVTRLARYVAAYAERFGTEPRQLSEYRTSLQEVAP